MKRLRTLNSLQIFKIKNKKSKTYTGSGSGCPFQGLSNGTTLMQIQSGWTVPKEGKVHQGIKWPSHDASIDEGGRRQR
jgi:hypothetical protein